MALRRPLLPLTGFAGSSISVPEGADGVPALAAALKDHTTEVRKPEGRSDALTPLRERCILWRSDGLCIERTGRVAV